uniref:(northern house mosquito) hypothetical protein n=1 Tax=Culex pipiens TaxID=7175 RepID=A0A8D8HPR0_CULPI
MPRPRYQQVPRAQRFRQRVQRPRSGRTANPGRAPRPVLLRLCQVRNPRHRRTTRQIRRTLHPPGLQGLDATLQLRTRPPALGLPHHHRHLPHVLRALLRPQPGPDVARPDRPQNPLQHRHRAGEAVRPRHPAGARPRKLPPVQHPARERPRQLDLHHPAGQFDVRPRRRHLLHHRDRHLW